MKPTHPTAAGFTIIELMVTIAVLSVLLGIGVPAFQNMIRNNRIATQANAVVTALNYARGETATRGVPVSICAVRAGTQDSTTPVCDGNAAGWANGWVIFTDRSGDPGVIDGSDVVLQTGSGPTGGFALETTASFIRFGVGAQQTTEVTFNLRPLDSSFCTATGRREISISLTGRINTSKSTC